VTARITTGRLVLIVGPSGSGKDTLLAAAARRIGEDPRIRQVRRVITRPAGEEANEALSEAEFAARDAAGGFALRWQAHGLSYGIPADITADLAAGRVVIANVSRSVVEQAAARFPVTVISRVLDVGRKSAAHFFSLSQIY
jgi:ribose 1,5-bisphosphokinase